MPSGVGFNGSAGNEDDITWHAVDALGELVDKKKAHEILLVLLKAANKPPDKGTSDEAPQVRYEALNSIEELAKNNLLNVDPELENLLSVSQFPYKERVAKAILELDPTDKAAQQVISKR